MCCPIISSWPSPSSISLHVHVYHLLGGIIPSLYLNTCMAIPSKLFLSEEGGHWFDVGFSPDVFVLGVHGPSLGLASNPSQHSHFSGV